MSDQSRAKRPTLADVAKLADVSPITVSRAIRGCAPVHADTKRRIDEAIAELGYVPNVAARQLARGQRNDLVGLMIHNLPHAFWSRVVLAMQADLVQHGIHALVVDTHQSQEEESRQLERLVQRGVSGIIAAPCAVDSPLPNLLRERGLPFVILNNRSDGACDAALVDEIEGMKRLARHLLALGHRPVALLSRDLRYFHYRERSIGFELALREAGLAADDDLIQVVTGDSCEGAATALLGRQTPPTAIIAASPGLAFGILYALGRRRIGVPDDIEVAVYGEMPTFGNLLTRACYEPAEELGRQAAEMLVERMDGYDGPARQVVMPVRIIHKSANANKLREDEN